MERLALSRDGFSPPPVPLDPDFLLKSSGRYEQFSTILGKAPTEQFCWVIPQSISSLNLLRLSFGRGASLPMLLKFNPWAMENT